MAAVGGGDEEAVPAVNSSPLMPAQQSDLSVSSSPPLPATAVNDGNELSTADDSFINDDTDLSIMSDSSVDGTNHPGLGEEQAEEVAVIEDSSLGEEKSGFEKVDEVKKSPENASTTLKNSELPQTSTVPPSSKVVADVIAPEAPPVIELTTIPPPIKPSPLPSSPPTTAPLSSSEPPQTPPPESSEVSGPEEDAELESTTTDLPETKASLPTTPSTPPKTKGGAISSTFPVSAPETPAASQSEEIAMLKEQLNREKLKNENLQQQLTEMEKKQTTEHILLEKDEAKIKILEDDLHHQQLHDKELEDVDKFLHSISDKISDDQLTNSISKLVEEYLVYCDYRNTVDCFTSEKKCVRFKPQFSYNSEKTGLERANGIKQSLLTSFDLGEHDPFMATWIANVPPALLASSKLNKVLQLKLNIHFALFPLKKRIVVDSTSPFPCSPIEKEAMERLKLALHEASEDPELQNESDIFPFFTLSTLSHPQTHPNFTNELTPQISIFEKSTSAADLTTNGWETRLRSELKTFCEYRLPLVLPPRLVTLFQAFNKWETSLSAHSTKNKEIAIKFRQQTLQLLGQNVSLIRDLPTFASKSEAQKTAYVSNMRRYLMSAKSNIDILSETIQSNNKIDTDQPPPLSYSSIADFVTKHRSELKLIGHVYCALNKRLRESSDVDVRRHGCHDAAIEDLLTLYIDKWEVNSVPMKILEGNSSDPDAASMDTDFLRANYYTAKLVNCLASFSTSRVYITSVLTNGGVFNALLTCVENVLTGKSSLESGITAMIALQKLSLETRTSFIAIELGVVQRVCDFLTKMPEKIGGPTYSAAASEEEEEKKESEKISLRFLSKEMKDINDIHDKPASDDHSKGEGESQTKASPSKTKPTWSGPQVYSEIYSSFITYGSGLIMNLCTKAAFNDSFAQAYTANKATNADIICPILKLVERLVTISNAPDFSSGDSDSLTLSQRQLLKGAYAALSVDAVKKMARGADGVNFIRGNMEIEGPIAVNWQRELTHILERMLQQPSEPHKGHKTEEVTTAYDASFSALEDNTIFPWDTFVSSEERLHSSIDKTDNGNLPEGWVDAIDPATGYRYYYKSDGTGESAWTLPIASEKILEAFYSSKRFM